VACSRIHAQSCACRLSVAAIETSTESLVEKCRSVFKIGIEHSTVRLWFCMGFMFFVSNLYLYVWLSPVGELFGRRWRGVSDKNKWWLVSLASTKNGACVGRGVGEEFAEHYKDELDW